jgi:hypothetical protein
MNGNGNMDDRDDLFDDDEIMRNVSKPPELAPASPAQIERTWQAITAHVEATRHTAGPQRGAVPTAAARRLGLFERLFPAAPAWSWSPAQVSALLLVGFGAAWIAASRGLLPGAVPPETSVAVVPEPATPATPPDRAWLAANDYSGRLEALLLGVTRGDEVGDLAPAAREVSRDLLDDNRFYQRIARHNQDDVLADLLSRVEVILLTLATAPEGQEQDVLRTLREYVDESDMLGELRAVQSSVPKTLRPRAATNGS